MTFYNVLSALLFLGSLRVLLVKIDAVDWPGIFTAGCLVTIVFNDMLSTSHVVESVAEIKYSLPLMIIDLVNFGFLALCMVILSPDKNLFDVSLPHLAKTLGRASFWLLLVLYWVLLMLWTRISCGDKPPRRTIVGLQSTIAATFAIVWLLQLFGRTQAANVVTPFVLLYLILYLTAIRPASWNEPATAT